MRLLRRRAPALADLLLTAALAVGGMLAVRAAAASAPTVLFELGPNETAYLRGFRPGFWETEGVTRFHWTTRLSTVDLPLHVRGAGITLRARIRRHFEEPAQVTLRAEGRSVASFSIRSDTETAYKIVEYTLPELQGSAPFSLSIESVSMDPRPLGIAIDWIELERGGGAFDLTGRAMGSWIALLAATFLVLRAAGGSRRLGTAAVCVLILAGTLGARADLLAFDRVVGLGTPAYLVVAALGLGTVVLLRRRSADELPLAPGEAGALVAILLSALAVRLVLLLHPCYFYPDVKQHGRVAYELAKRGLASFLARYTETQYLFSLGLQSHNGHVYPFPYPPGLSLLAWPLIRFFGVWPEVAVSLLAAVANSLALLVVFILARHLTRSNAASLTAAVAHAALPLFFVRLSLAYFPSQVGTAMDACALTYFAMTLARLTPRRAVAAGLLLTVSLLLYTQSMINFGMLLPLYLLWDLVVARTTEDRRRQALVAIAGALAVLIAFALFYSRYVGPMRAMHEGRPVPQEQLLLDKQQVERAYAHARGEELVAVDDPDPYAGPDFSLTRGLRKIATRLWIFYGAFAVTVLWGVAIVVSGRAGTERRFLIVWSSLYFLMGLAAVLPGENLLRYGKDLEVVAPLFCVGFAVATDCLRRWARPLAWLHVGGFVLFGLVTGYETWRATFESLQK